MHVELLTLSERIGVVLLVVSTVCGYFWLFRAIWRAEERKFRARMDKLNARYFAYVEPKGKIPPAPPQDKRDASVR